MTQRLWHNRRGWLLGAVAVATGLAGCSVPTNVPEAYGDRTRENFVAACTAADPDTGDRDITAPTVAAEPRVPVEVCECRYDWIVDHVPFDDGDRARLPDYDGPTYRAMSGDANEDGRIPQNVLDEWDRACPIDGSTPASSTTTADAAPTSTAPESTTTTASTAAESTTTSSD